MAIFDQTESLVMLYFVLFCECIFFTPRLFLILFLFWSSLYGLRWIICGGIVAYYVECTNVVNKWHGSECVNRRCGVATISRFLKIVGLFCKRAL